MNDLQSTSDFLAQLDVELPHAQRIVTCTIEGIVEPADIQALLTRPQPPAGTDVGDLKRIRERHHSIARMVAQGMTQRMVSTIVQMTEARISTLLKAPAMQELVAYYRSQHSAAQDVIAERLRTVALTSIEELSAKLEAGELEPQELLGLAKLGLDRSGHGPRSTVHNVSEHHIVDHAELQRLNAAARADSSEHIIDVTPAVLPAPDADSGDEDAG